MKATSVLKALTLVSSAGLLMGNQSCQQQVPTTRTYKKIVEMGSIAAQPIKLPDGSSFDFRFVANQQLYGVVAESTNFTLRSAPPISSNPAFASTSSVADSNYFNLSKADMSMLQKGFDESKSDFRSVFSRSAWCMVNFPQAKIYGSINSFEMVGGGGLSIGYTPAGPVSSGIAGANMNFNVQYAQLDLSMRALPPLGSTILGATNVTAKQTKTNINLGINFGLFSIGPSYFYSTPLATVTKRGLATGLTQLYDQMAKDDWYSRVFADQDTQVVVVGGSDVGYKIGDQLDIYNEQYAWDGEPCNSNYLGSTGMGSDSYYARVEIISVGDQLSQAKVIKIDPNATQSFASVGAKVKLYKFKETLDAEAAAAKTKGSSSSSSSSSSTTNSSSN